MFSKSSTWSGNSSAKSTAKRRYPRCSSVSTGRWNAGTSSRQVGRHAFCSNDVMAIQNDMPSRPCFWISAM
eukprot:10363901-Lingulodinium_polyedra.AAC.1